MHMTVRNCFFAVSIFYIRYLENTYLDVGARIPVWVVQQDSVGSSQVHTQAAHLTGQMK